MTEDVDGILCAETYLGLGVGAPGGHSDQTVMVMNMVWGSLVGNIIGVETMLGAPHRIPPVMPSRRSAAPGHGNVHSKFPITGWSGCPRVPPQRCFPTEFAIEILSHVDAIQCTRCPPGAPTYMLRRKWVGAPRVASVEPN